MAIVSGNHTMQFSSPDPRFAQIKPRMQTNKNPKKPMSKPLGMMGKTTSGRAN